MTKQELEKQKKQLEWESQVLKMDQIQNQQMQKDINTLQNLKANKLYYIFWTTIITILGIPLSTYTYFMTSNTHILALIAAMSILDILNVTDIALTQKNIKQKFASFQNLREEEFNKLEKDYKEKEKELEKLWEYKQDLLKEVEKKLTILDSFDQYQKEKIDYASIHFSNDWENEVGYAMPKQLRKVK